MLKVCQLASRQNPTVHIRVGLATNHLFSLPRQDNHVTISTRFMSTEVVQESLKRFKDIPGPTRYPLLGTALDLVKGGGATKLQDIHKKNFKQFGPIYREVIPGIPGRVMVNVAHPEAVETVYRSEGLYPERPGFDLFDVYFKEKKVRPFGIQLQGEDWFHSRNILAPKMMMPKAVEESMGHFSEVANDAMKRMKSIRPPDGQFANIEDEVFRYSMESVAFYAIGKRIGLFANNPDKTVFEFMKAGQDFFQYMAALLLSFPAYRYVSTPTWKGFRSSLDKIRHFGQVYVDQMMEELKNSPSTREKYGASLLEYLLEKGDMEPDEISTACIFQLLGGVDTTGYSIVWVMYHLAKNTEAQEKLHEELSTVLKSDEPTPQALQKMPFLKACVKESQRLRPLATLIPRCLKKDVDLLGYHIPKNTWINVHNYGMGCSEEFFKEPEKYIPERWLRQTRDAIHPYAFLPFGHGPRQCVGRRVAELEMYIFLIKLVQSFKMEHPGETGMIFKVGIYPEKRMKFRVEER